MMTKPALRDILQTNNSSKAWRIAVAHRDRRWMMEILHHAGLAADEASRTVAAALWGAKPHG